MLCKNRHLVDMKSLWGPFFLIMRLFLRNAKRAVTVIKFPLPQTQNARVFAA